MMDEEKFYTGYSLRLSWKQRQEAERLRALLGERSIGSVVRRLLREEGERRGLDNQPCVKQAA